MSTGSEAQGGPQAAAASTQSAGSLLDQITQRMPKAVEKPRRDELIRSRIHKFKTNSGELRFLSLKEKKYLDK